MTVLMAGVRAAERLNGWAASCATKKAAGTTRAAGTRSEAMRRLAALGLLCWWQCALPACILHVHVAMSGHRAQSRSARAGTTEAGQPAAVMPPCMRPCMGTRIRAVQLQCPRLSRRYLCCISVSRAVQRRLRSGLASAGAGGGGGRCTARRAHGGWCTQVVCRVPTASNSLRSLWTRRICAPRPPRPPHRSGNLKRGGSLGQQRARLLQPHRTGVQSA